tara:strand:+ start:930 stop:1352 length:423 start_codon:yes stop_codon:yes gene_type:complete
MENFNTYNEFNALSYIAEANKGKVHRAAKQGSYPAVVVVVQDGKVIHQEPVSTPDVAPATFNVMQEKYPKALLHLEDNTGKRLFSESVVNEAEVSNTEILDVIDSIQGLINDLKKDKTKDAKKLFTVAGPLVKELSKLVQ